MAQRTFKDYIGVGMGAGIPIVTIVVLLLGVNDYIDKKIQNRLKDPETVSFIDKRFENNVKNPEFVRMVADKVRLPFIIFDENGTFLNNSGGEDYVEAIKITRKPNKYVDEITVIGKRFLNSAPILQNIDGKIQFYDGKRVDQKNWKFKAFQYTYLVTESSPKDEPPYRFKLEIIP